MPGAWVCKPSDHESCEGVGREVPAVEMAVLVVDVDGFAGDIDGGNVDAPFVVAALRADKGHHFLHVLRTRERICLGDIRVEDGDLVQAAVVAVAVVLREQQIGGTAAEV